MERNVLISTPGDLKRTPLESSELRAGRKVQTRRRNELQFMESISTQSGGEDFLKRNVDDSAVNSDKSAYLDSSKSVSTNEFKLRECKYLDPKQEIVNSQFSLNLSLLKKLNLSGTKLGGSPLKPDRAPQQAQKNLYVKLTKERIGISRYPSQELDHSQRSDRRSGDSGRFSNTKELSSAHKSSSNPAKEGFNAARDSLVPENQKFTLVKNNFSNGNQPMSSRSNASRDSYRSGDHYKNAPDHAKFHDSRTAQTEVSLPVHPNSLKAVSPSDQPRHSHSTNVDKSLNHIHFVSGGIHTSPKHTHRTLKDVKITSPRNHKQNLQDYHNSHKYTHQSFKHSQYLPRDTDQGSKRTILTSLKGPSHVTKDSQKSQRHTHQPHPEEKARELLDFVNDSIIGSHKEAQKASREDRKVPDEALDLQPMDSSYLRNPAARVRNVQFWFKPFSTSKSSCLNAYNGLQVIESLTGNVQKSWHLEAIKGLDRNNYGELKMTMLRLTNSRFNLHPNRLLIRCRGSWDIIQEGSFGTVYLGFVEGHGNSAVKVPNAAMLKYDPVGVMKRFINEWDILSRCSHRNIVNIYGGIILGVFDIWLCTELVNGVDLHSVKYGSNYSFGNQIHQMLNNASASHQPHGVPSTLASGNLNSGSGVGNGGVKLKPTGVSNLKFTASGAANSLNRGDASKHSSRTPRLIPPSAALKMCHQLADALVYLHTPTSTKGIVVHRDIKPENIIVDSQWNIKLCDFGDTFETSSGLINSVSGATWLYAPPELLLHPSIRYEFLGSKKSDFYQSSCSNSSFSNPEESYPLTEKWDIWSFGCVVQEMFGYTGPFHHIVSMNDPPNVVCEKMVNAAYRGLVPNIPNQLAKTKMGALILQCLDPVPDNRPSALEIKLILQNPDILST